MKKRVEDNELFAEVLAADERLRAAILEHGLAALRQTRMRRRAVRLMAGTTASLLILAGAWIAQHRREAVLQLVHSTTTQPPVPKTIAGTPIRVLSDEELLDMFKGRPVALVGQPGHQRLVLLDEKN
jgi:hypothetical protein